MREATDRSVLGQLQPIFTGKVIKQLLVKTAPALEINLLHQKPTLHIWGGQFQLTTEGGLLNILDLKEKTFHIYKGIEL